MMKEKIKRIAGPWLVQLYYKLRTLFFHIFHKKYLYIHNSRRKAVEIENGRHTSYTLAEGFQPKIIYSFGIGDNAIFEKRCIEMFPECEVYAFDPMPSSEQYLDAQNMPDSFHFKRYAISATSSIQKCFLPPEGFIDPSGSLKKENIGWAKLSDNYIEVPAYTLKDLMAMNNHSRIDILKLCCEGLEYDVMNNIMNDGIEIDQIAVALCGRSLSKNFDNDRSLYKLMRAHGYKLIRYYSDSKITFVKNGR